MSPVRLFNPPSMASIPSSMLHSSRSWMHAAATISHAARSSRTGAIANAAAAPAAKTTLMTEIVLGRTPLAVSRRASALAHDVFRVASTRRAAGGGTEALLMGLRLPRAFRVAQRIAFRRRALGGRCEPAITDERVELRPDLSEARVELTVIHGGEDAVVVRLRKIAAVERERAIRPRRVSEPLHES